MKVSELIEHLQDIKNANGDVDVKIIFDEPTLIERNICVGMEAAGIDCIITNQPEWFPGTGF